MLHKFENKVALVTGAASGIGPNGNRLDFDVVDIFRIESGMIAEHWDVADSLKLFTQLGIAERLSIDKH